MIELDNHQCRCKEGCVINSAQHIFTVEGTSTKYILINNGKNPISKYIVDHCLLAKLPLAEKCDYLFADAKNEKVIFLELKGSNVIKAINQIISSIAKISLDDRYKKHARIVTTKTPSPKYYNSQRMKLNKLLTTNVIIKSKQFQETI